LINFYRASTCVSTHTTQFGYIPFLYVRPSVRRAVRHVVVLYRTNAHGECFGPSVSSVSQGLIDR